MCVAESLQPASAPSTQPSGPIDLDRLAELALSSLHVLMDPEALDVTPAVIQRSAGAILRFVTAERNRAERIAARQARDAQRPEGLERRRDIEDPLEVDDQDDDWDLESAEADAMSDEPLTPADKALLDRFERHRAALLAGQNSSTSEPPIDPAPAHPP